MKRPPTLLYQILTWCCPSDRQDVLGDFEEWYVALAEEKGTFKANLIWLLHSISLLKFRTIAQKSKTHYIMLGLHLKLAKRNLLGQKLYTFIHLVGLTVGFTVCTLIGLFIHHELSYDRHFKGYENIYRVAGEYDHGGGTKSRSTLTPYLLMPTMANNLDSQVVYTRIDVSPFHVTLGSRTFWEDYSAVVDSTFFEVFQTEFMIGDPHLALDNPNSLVLDHSTATKYFEEGQAFGQNVEIGGVTHTVTGVIKDLPDQTHFRANLFVPIASIKDTYPHWMTNTFGGVSHHTYLRVPGGFDVNQLATSLNELVASYVQESDRPHYFFQSLSDIHLTSDLQNEIRVNGSYLVLYIFVATALVILLLACINFINLAVAGALTRLKEIGVKKVLGASRKSQVWQFQMEALFVSIAAAILSILMVELTLPVFSEVSGKAMIIGMPQYAFIAGTSLLLVFFISFVSGSFPALFLLKIPTPDAVTGRVASQSKQGLKPATLLVGLQFFLSAILIASTLIILQQVHFMKKKNLGIDTAQIIVASLQSDESVINYSLLKEQLLQDPSVVHVSASSSPLSARVGGWRQYRKPTTAEDISIPTVVVGHDYFSMIDAEFVAGRPFQKEMPTDHQQAYVINEAAAKFMELEAAVGANLRGSAFTGQQWSTKDARIIGVVKDFHFAPLHDKIRPVVFSLSSESTIPMRWLFIKVRPENMITTLENIEATWEAVNADTPLRYRFLEDAIGEHYLEEVKFLKIFSSFSGLSIFIGCLGLFGLTAFSMRKRTKEIGIRKVLGASRVTMLKILSQDFVRLVIISGTLGIPFTIILMRQWLENFEYRIGISWWVFTLTIGGSLLIACFSIFYHAYRLATTNPVESIKCE